MIIDGHAHMMTESVAKGMKIKIDKIPEQFRKMIGHSVEKNIAIWLKAMDNFGVDKTVFMGTAPLNKDFTKFINASDRFIGFAPSNPTLPNAVVNLKKEIRAGMKGVKLYATSGAFNVGSKRAYPFYKYCQENNIPIVIHFGVTIGGHSDLTTGNPLLLSEVLKDFPEQKFIIAHFGAGFFREVLMLKYKAKNLFVDTSGTNNWLPHQDNFLTLRDVFKKTIEVFTSNGIIFGTDTRIFPDGYRQNIVSEQTKILDDLGLSPAEKQDIMYNNAKIIFGI